MRTATRVRNRIAFIPPPFPSRASSASERARSSGHSTRTPSIDANVNALTLPAFLSGVGAACVRTTVCADADLKRIAHCDGNSVSFCLFLELLSLDWNILTQMRVTSFQTYRNVQTAVFLQCLERLFGFLAKLRCVVGFLLPPR